MNGASAAIPCRFLVSLIQFYRVRSSKLFDVGTVPTAQHLRLSSWRREPCQLVANPSISDLSVASIMTWAGCDLILQPGAQRVKIEGT